jgi:hypothetical protein
MRKESTRTMAGSRVYWEHLEEWPPFLDILIFTLYPYWDLILHCTLAAPGEPAIFVLQL